MSSIRPLQVDDVPQVARLFDLVREAGGDERRGDLVAFFRRTLFESPWTDAELPSFAYVEGNEVLGFITSNVRRMRFDGRPVRMVCSANLVVDPRARPSAAGARLLKTLLSGPQDLTITDGATDEVRRMWERLGGSTVHLNCLSFLELFRPWQLARDTLLGTDRRRPLGRATAPLSWALDHGTTPFLPKASPEDGSALRAEPLRPAAMTEHLPALTHSLRLVPDYDLPYVEWLFGELEAVTDRGTLWAGGLRRGRLWAELVREGTEARGWYVCHLRRGGLCRVLQLAADSRYTERVYDRLVTRARENGAAAVFGRVETHLMEALARHRVLVRNHPGRLLVHAPDTSIVSAIQAGDALLTRLDGEWW